MEKNESTCSLLRHLNKYVAAYRKSYRFCRGVHLSIQIISGGCGAAAALIPAVPIAVAVAGTNPAGITVVLRFAKLEAQFRIFKQLFREARIMSAEKTLMNKK